MSLDRPLYVLACDHRTSFQRGLFGIPGAASPEQRERMTAAKSIVLDGLEAAADGDETVEATLGALFDEELGAEAARRTRGKGLALAICAEKSSQPEFDFEYGEAFGEHIDAFAPDYVKILARYNPGGDAELNRRQAQRLAALSDWLAPGPIELLFELLVPPEAEQLAAVDDDRARYVAELRPALAAEAIGELHRAGVEPGIWKVEGLDSVADCDLVAAAARAGGRDDVRCLVLGAGADDATVKRWLTHAARSEGFGGFAIGRTIFWDALSAWNAGAIDRAAAVTAIAENYRRMIDVYEAERRAGLPRAV
jgi:5-dehydro-2-deoxygluconokinase